MAKAKAKTTAKSKAAVAYDEKAIQTLDALEHIRLRTGMYIGRIGDGSHPDDGIYVLVKEVIDNAIDEFIMGEGDRIEITHTGNQIQVRDFGRGIPLGKVVACVSQINTGGKYNDDVFQFSVGLNGVGTKAVNALSSSFEVCSYREQKYKRAEFSRGKLQGEKGGKDVKSPQGTWVQFEPDAKIFGDYAWQWEFIARRLRYYAYLNKGLTLVYNDEVFLSKNGLQDLLTEEIGNEKPIYPPIHYTDKRLEFSLTHIARYGEKYFSFVNGQFTNDGGTHQSAFREGVLKGINAFAGRNFAGEDVREGILGAVAVKLQDPVFESQTKNKLGSTEVRSWVVQSVKSAIELWLHKHEPEAKALLEKIKINEKIRKELAAVRKEAKERAKKVAIRIPKLTDCRDHLNDPKAKRGKMSTLFITEGDSAGGAMVQARDVYTQAIFTLKGKPLNCYGQNRDAVYKNEELYNLMRALGIEDDLTELRYNRVVIATDADVDGMHIRNLLLTYFLRFFEPLVAEKHVFVLETPLFRVRNKKETVYCYSEAERDAAQSRLSHPETTRFKGLGEINPLEFKRFIGSDAIRLIPVELSLGSDPNSVLDFLMGKNTPARKKFIVENLLIDIA